MSSLDHYAHAVCLDGVQDSVSDLLGQPFLDLEPARKHIDKTGQLADAEDGTPGYIADVAAAEKRQHVMLAEAVYLDVADNYHARSLLRKTGAVDQRLRILLIARSKKSQRLGYPFGGFHQAFALRVLPYLSQQFPDKTFNFLYVHGSVSPFLNSLYTVSEVSSRGRAAMQQSPRLTPLTQEALVPAKAHGAVRL